MGGADDHEATVGADIVDAVGDGDAGGLGAEVVVVDGLWSFRPLRTNVQRRITLELTVPPRVKRLQSSRPPAPAITLRPM